MTRTSTFLTVGLASVAGALVAVGSAGAQSAVDATISGDTLRVTGTSGDDAITLRLRAGDATTVEIDAQADGSADASFPLDGFTKIVVLGRSGSDVLRIDDANGSFTTTEQTTLDGGSGSDTLVGGGGAELMLGGSGNDGMDGNRGNDTGVLGSGNDAFTWDPGDGNDIIEGQSGRDTMIFNGAGGAETFDMSANGDRLRFFRQPGNVLMDTASVEVVAVNALGSTDVVTINDLAATDVDLADIDLGLALGATGGDGAVDQVIVNATQGDDDIAVSGSAGTISVDGLVPGVRITDADSTDQLRIETLGGTDVVDTAALVPGTVSLFVDGTPA